MQFGGDAHSVPAKYIISEIFFKNSAKLLLAVVYRPPNSGYLNEFFLTFSELHVNYRHAVIFGDFNADMSQMTFDSRQLGTLASALNLHVVPYETTHHLKDSNTLLDLCIIDDMEKGKDYGQYDVTFLSAHDLIYIRYEFKVRRRFERCILCRDWRGLDMDSLLSDIGNIDWSDLLDTNDMGVKMNVFNNKLLEVFDTHAPFKRRFFRNLPAPWLTEDIRSAMRERDLARRLWRRYKCARNHERYKELRNKAQNLVRSAKSTYYLGIFNNARDARDVWGGLRRLGLIRPRNIGGSLSHTVEELNRFFVSGLRHSVTEDHTSQDSLDGILTGDFSDRTFIGAMLLHL